ncbi:uncharacterized protein LOC113207363 [Frankliniella occidentalis]|uniref:Uncharacterized protein LOC113207363 n=1 Tax=Frankliniella occidentalis TaxID=133901 RepID=A0A6J1SK13_FRAOC|nr:uncharacterized protein LOC113207363 [Frankliniella occidentalis]
MECDTCTEHLDNTERLPDSRCPSCHQDRSGARDPPPAAAPAPPAAPNDGRDPQPAADAQARPPREMEMTWYIGNSPDDEQQRKAAALRDAPGVRRLVGVRCDRDPAWSLQLLQRAAPSVEQLSVYGPREAHLRAVHAMPRLTRLLLSCHDAALAAQPPELPALPTGHSRLQWLRVWDFPRAGATLLQSLLRAHGHSLEFLQLQVGTAGDKEWPESCGDLHSLLEPCGLRALRRLVLQRGARRFTHGPAPCGQQRAQVRRVLPGAEVLCIECDDVEWDDL